MIKEETQRKDKAAEEAREGRREGQTGKKGNTNMKVKGEGRKDDEERIKQRKEDERMKQERGEKREQTKKKETNMKVLREGKEE